MWKYNKVFWFALRTIHFNGFDVETDLQFKNEYNLSEIKLWLIAKFTELRVLSEFKVQTEPW